MTVRRHQQIKSYREKALEAQLLFDSLIQQYFSQVGGCFRKL